ncbi:restriction endonuclease subunit S [Clostridium isatidis]|uniref:Type I restriction modification DNA specificity domain-containing protein n=1 Tax=Clostridium isatidis TaxID=182773 RepID=A0A343JBF1_9CLOT|nr:restriction endonuclease subunit S [Clostridium isatidis]ASW42859.1 hypothetical protein BEN51_05055 [Clostridium isatidis]
MGKFKNNNNTVPNGWQQKRIDEVSILTMGASPSSASYNEEKIGLPLIQGNADCRNRKTFPRIYTREITKECKVGDIIMTVRAPAGAISKSVHNACIGRGVCAIEPKINSEFLYQVLVHHENSWSRLSQGSTFEAISGSDIKSFTILVPTNKEQEKIAEILSTWDLAIEKQEQLIEKKKEFKKGLMQRLLSGEVRFKEFNDDWKFVSLGTIFERITQKNNINCTNVLTISAQNGLVNQEDYFNKSVSSKDLSGYYLLNKRDFAYNKSYSKGYPLGAIKRLNNYDEGVVSPLYICFRAKEKISTCFYEQYFESGFLNKEIFKIAQEGARNHGLLNISVTEFFKDIKIAKPSLEEQDKIAEVLIQADKEIELLQKELEALKLQKKGLMQRLLTGEVRVRISE